MRVQRPSDGGAEMTTALEGLQGGQEAFVVMVEPGVLEGCYEPLSNVDVDIRPVADYFVGVETNLTGLGLKQ